jgi:hypothetical protein
MPGRRQLPLDALARDTERSGTSFVLPAAIHERLDWLVDAAVGAGEDRRLSRTEVVAALVATAPQDGDALRDSLHAYRTATVRDLLLEDHADVGENVVALNARRPGPRSR